MTTLGERIELALKEKPAKQADLARACKITSGAVTQWKTGDTKMNASSAHRAAEFLGVSFLWLTEGTGPMRRATEETFSGATPTHAQLPEVTGIHADLIAAFERLPPTEQRRALLEIRYRADLAELENSPPTPKPKQAA